MKVLSTSELDQVFEYCSRKKDIVFFDNSKIDRNNHISYLFCDPVEKIRFYKGDDLKSFFASIQEKIAEGFYVAGWMSYELGLLFEEKLASLAKSDGREKLAEFGVFHKPKSYNHQSGENDFPLHSEDSNFFSECDYSLINVSPNLDYETYHKAVRAIKEYIAAGDTYQVNYTLKLLFDFHGSEEKFYRDLRRNQSVSYGSYMRFGDEYTLSFSPELFFCKSGENITMKPMKGTVKKGNTFSEVVDNATFLKGDIKNRSENVMIVDLLRNDLGRLIHCLSGGDVSVQSLFDVEEYETLLQMTSTIIGRTEKEAMVSVSPDNLFKALFPCGSITGAPKIRTMEIIDELEVSERGVYTGCIGFFAPNGDATFNVPIRTVVLKGGKGEMGIGSGIVHDSQPESEWQECLLKADFLTKPVDEFELIETILWQNSNNGFYLIDEHLERLRQSASFFNYVFDEKKIREVLKEKDEKFLNAEDTAFRLRITLAKDGALNTSDTPCVQPKIIELPLPGNVTGLGDFPVIAIHDQLVDTKNPWFYHKTTRRRLFDETFQDGLQKGLSETCFVNLQGEITEGCISNIILLKGDNYLTPPLSSGLLSGIMRSHLIKNNSILVREQKLTVEDLECADAIFLCNSVRGVWQVQLAN